MADDHDLWHCSKAEVDAASRILAVAEGVPVPYSISKTITYGCLPVLVAVVDCSTDA